MEDIHTTSEGSTKTSAAILQNVAATPLEWTSSFHSLRGNLNGNLGYGFRLLGLLLILSSGVGLITGKGSLAILAGFLMVIMVGHLFVPVTYHLNSEGIKQTVLGRNQFKPWSDFQAARINNLVLQLYPKDSLLQGKSRAILCIPLGESESMICEKLRRLIPLRVEHAVTENTTTSSD